LGKEHSIEREAEGELRLQREGEKENEALRFRFLLFFLGEIMPFWY
jgi:hypothetical protein